MKLIMKKNLILLPNGTGMRSKKPKGSDRLPSIGKLRGNDKLLNIKR